LTKVIDHAGLLLEATYDDYNRAITLNEEGMRYQCDFSLEKKTLRMTNAQGKTATLHFDHQDRLIYRQDFSGLIWSFAYGQDHVPFPNQIVDPKGGVTECSYNPSGDLVYLKNPLGAEWRFFYDAERNLVAQQDPKGKAIVHLYDGNHRVTQTFLKAFLDFDPHDRLTGSYRKCQADGGYMLHFVYDPETGHVALKRNTKGAQTLFAYHPNGQLKEVVYPTGYKITHTVKGNVVEISDAFGMDKRYEYEEDGRLHTLYTPSGTISFKYNQNGSLEEISDPKGIYTSYTHYTPDQLASVTDGEGGVSRYEYSTSGQLTHLTLPNGSCKTIEYDACGRLCRETWGR
jgi:YD repeat-containing protein